MMEAKHLKINPADNVAVAITALPAGEKLTVDGKEITLNEDVPAGHKFALKDFAEGENVIKYGYPIGHARKAQKQGDWMNENNIKTNLSGLLEYTYNPVNVDLNTTTLNLNTGAPNLTFRGYKRKNGDVGVRNEIWIIPTVGCVNGIINQLAEGLRRETGGKGVDAIMAYPHNYGCSQLGDDHENTKKILRDMVLHPNAGAVLVVGLGCENNQPDVFREFLGDYDQERVKFMVTQKVGDEYEEGMELLRELYAKAIQDQREDIPLSELRVGLKCGGSDGFSGITANPLLGMFSDFLVAQGGTSVLTEVPEMFGAETILMNRCRTKELFEDTVKLINDFKEYFLSHGEPVGENPSPGNKAEASRHWRTKPWDAHRNAAQATWKGTSVWRTPESKGTEPAVCSGKRPCSRHCPCLLRMPHGAVHHRTRNALRNLCADHEDFHQLHFGKEQAGLDRLQRRSYRRERTDEENLRTLHRVYHQSSKR